MQGRFVVAALLFAVSFGRHLEGEFNVIVEDHLTECVTYAALFDANNNTFRLAPETIEAMEFHAGDIVRLEVEEEDDSAELLHVVDGLTIGHSVAKQLAQNSRRGAQRLLIVLVNYANAQAVFSGCGEACIRDFTWRRQFNVDTVYRHSSYGAVSFPENQGLITSVTLQLQTNVHSPGGRNDLGRIRADTTAALTAQRRIDHRNFDFLAIYTPALSGIGVAFMNGRDSFMNSNHPDTLAHELGHNFGKGHAGLDLQNNLRPTEEYGDRSSTMGYSHESMRPFNMPHQLHTGWVPANRVVSITDTCRGQVVTLHATHTIPTDPTHRLAVTIARDPGHTYVVSLRTALGHDTLLRAQYLNVVSIHYINPGGFSNLVALVRPSTTYTDPVNGYTFAVGRLEGNTIRVTFCTAARAIRPPVSTRRTLLNFGPASAAEDHAGSKDSSSHSRDIAVAVVVTLLVVGVFAAVAVVVMRRRQARRRAHPHRAPLASGEMDRI